LSGMAEQYPGLLFCGATTVRSICLFLIFWMTPGFAANAEPPIRFGLTAVIVTENIRFLDKWSQYLEAKWAARLSLCCEDRIGM